MTEAKPVKTLRSDQEMIATVTDSIFFKYMINEKGPDLETTLIKLNLSTKKHLQVYIDKNRYPSAESNEHNYAIGDLPDSLLKVMGQKTGMLEIMQDLSPFVYDSESGIINYTGSFKHMNQDLCKIEH